MNRLLSIQQELVSIKPDNMFVDFKNKSTINFEELKEVIYGPNYRERDEAIKIVKQNPKIFEHYHITEASRDHQRELTTRQFVFVTSVIKDKQIQGSLNPNKFSLFGNGFTFYDLNLVTKLGVHYSLYLKTIERLSTTQIHRQFYQRACKFQDYGCFALTELLHGSNVKGLLTEAHYDHQSRELIINSPTRDAMKFWIGGAAKTSNMCIVWAQLYVKGKCHGVHAIIVPIRDQVNHKVLPGIRIGDCGPKFGLNGVDNGFIEFNHFRVPVANLLNKVSGITESGQFVSSAKNENERFGMTLAALSQGRFFMCCHSTSLALSALAIAIRYTFVRRQFASKEGQKQNYLIEYPLTKRRMIPSLALEVIYMCITMNTFYISQNNAEKNSLSNDNPLLKQIHAISSVLKAKTAWAATEIIRQCRQMMGGHGYSAYSKMSALYGSNDVNNTWEGENNVLIQQTTKFIMQNYQKAILGKTIQSPLLKFFQNPPEQKPFQINISFLLNLQQIKQYLMAAILRKVQQMGNKMMSLKEQNIAPADIWNSNQVYLGNTLAMITGDLYILNFCLEKMKEIKHQQTRTVFTQITHLWALLVIKNDQAIDEQYHTLIQTTILEYSEMLLPQVLGILEALVGGQYLLGSPFANQYGQGFHKYMNLVLSQPRKERADYWEMVARQ